jgi:hypothetical protein
LAGIAGFAFFDTQYREPPPQPALQIRLDARQTPDGIEITWDRSLAAAQKITSGLLVINDGSSERQIELDAAALTRGSLIYKPSGADLLFRMSVAGAEKQSAAESFRIASVSPSPSKVHGSEAEKAGAASPPIPAPDPAVAAAPETPQASPATPLRASLPEPAVAAVAIHEVQPGISEGVQARIESPVTIPINVRIDAAGRVTAAAVHGDGDGLYRYLAERARQAARFWRFRPAVGRNGKSVPSTKTLFFVFRG